MNTDARLLLRYVDREMSAIEAEQFRARLLKSPELHRQVQEMQALGALLRGWSKTVESRANVLVEPTLERVRLAERRRSRQLWLGYGLLILLSLALHGALHDDSAELRPNPAQAQLIDR